MKFIQLCLNWYIIWCILININMRKSILKIVRFFAPDCICIFKCFFQNAYFTVMLLRKDCVDVNSVNLADFPTSMMSRNLLEIEVSFVFLHCVFSNWSLFTHVTSSHHFFLCHPRHLAHFDFQMYWYWRHFFSYLFF